MAISSVDGLNQRSLPDEHLIDVQEDVAALNNHSLDGQILSNVFCLTHLVEQGWQCNSLKYFGFFLDCPVGHLKIFLESRLKLHGGVWVKMWRDTNFQPIQMSFDHPSEAPKLAN